MADDPQRFRVIKGGERPKRHRARKRGEAEVLTCYVCEQDTGVATALTIEMKQGRMVADGKPQGGSKVIYCAHCLSRGKLTRLL
ncbi:hypothetical protein [Rhodobium gokarnense]|uniref:DUF448 domain-containing protein n=1 Tax=Rhodobium gokarnense TaxID=364296 RepID=A0ABT3HH42_9HYPH|nr:hypothetical protein [Rhodobium gokarnense]MCW2309714.1 hypothetical protein [Rhodobium gokarnense]